MKRQPFVSRYLFAFITSRYASSRTVVNALKQKLPTAYRFGVGASKFEGGAPGIRVSGWELRFRSTGVTP
jgi:hypothetical protein